MIAAIIVSARAIDAPSGRKSRRNRRNRLSH